MTAKEQILRVLHEQRALLDRRYPIRRLALFGSWARGDAREDSDVDVLVEVDPSIGMRFVELAEDLEQALGRHVDLVSRRSRLSCRNWREHLQPSFTISIG
jgi:predicted nucleotidyltransferase